MPEVKTAPDESDLRYDPYDFEIDTDPYPVWRRMRDECPLYYNAQHEFYALSRFTDVDAALADWRTYISSRGTVLDLLKMDFVFQPGSIIFEDPPLHDTHRALLSRVFRPKDIAALEPKIREFCAQSLDPLVGADGFDFVLGLGAQMPMRTISMLLGIPDDEQEKVREIVTHGIEMSSEEGRGFTEVALAAQQELFNDFVARREQNPGDDLTSELLAIEFEDDTGATRRLTREEIVNYALLLAGAGNETTTRLIGWAAKLLAEHPDQLAQLAADASLIPNAIEEILRYEAPSPVQGRYVTAEVEHYGQAVPAGSIMLLINGSANRDERKFDDPDRFDIHRRIERHVSFGYGVHFCMGAALARLEGRIALEEVLKRFPSWQVDYNSAKQARTSSVRGWERMPVVFS